ECLPGWVCGDTCWGRCAPLALLALWHCGHVTPWPCATPPAARPYVEPPLRSHMATWPCDSGNSLRPMASLAVLAEKVPNATPQALSPKFDSNGTKSGIVPMKGPTPSPVWQTVRPYSLLSSQEFGRHHSPEHRSGKARNPHTCASLSALAPAHADGV